MIGTRWHANLGGLFSAHSSGKFISSSFNMGFPSAFQGSLPLGIKELFIPLLKWNKYSIFCDFLLGEIYVYSTVFEDKFVQKSYAMRK